jgi:hypothetical protein
MRTILTLSAAAVLAASIASAALAGVSARSHEATASGARTASQKPAV